MATQLSYKIYFIDNSPDKKLESILKTLAPDDKYEYHFTGKNLGYGAAHNIAIKKIIDESQFHLVVNPDVYFSAEVLHELHAFALDNADVGQIIPKVLYPDGSLQYVCKLLPTPFNLLLRLLPQALFKKYNQKFELRFSGYNKIMNVPYLHGCFMFLRCSALKEIGLFDKRFFLYPEDIDLTRRMHKKYKTIFYPYVQVFHHHAKASHKNLKLFFIHVQNIIKYFNKWGWLFDAERRRFNKLTLKQIECFNKQII